MEEGREIVEKQPSTEGELAPKKEIGEEELGTLISAFGNHELKALTLASMRPGIIYTRRVSEGTTLAQELRERLQGKRTTWAIWSGHLFGYCQDSLSHPLTIVTRKTVDSDLGIYGYNITDYGTEKGQALAGHLLEWSLKFDKSLIEVFGSTSSGGISKEIKVGEETVEFKKRAPITRFKIFWGLLTSSLPIRVVDLANAIGETKEIIQDHLINLARFGVVYYKAIRSEQPYSFYQLADERPSQEPQPYRRGSSRAPTLTRRIYNLFTANPNLRASQAEVYQRLIEIYSSYQERKQSGMRTTINSILSSLEQQGFVRHEGFRQGIKSEINLTEDQRIMLYELLEILDKFQSGNREFWQEGRKKAQDILADPEKLVKLINKAQKTSPGTERIPREDLEDQLSSLLSRYPNSTVRQLREYLEREYGKRLGQEYVSRILRKSRRFIGGKEHHVNYWTVNGDPN